ncbi:CHAT domain-containing protein [Arthrobacter sp. H14-L1]|uniref:CHAT domain-containing protein n=1 Tax=Arthrobacter sp. H14-L1 TaxID=2996697 RepID=UPI00227202D8|nr:CHAT domain-containing protein [Arthrobacter sp. H14-L1]
MRYAIGLISVNAAPAWNGDPADPGPEMSLARVTGAMAVDQAATAGDQDLLTWVLLQVASVARRANDFRASRDLAEKGLAAAMTSPRSGYGPWSLMEAAGNPDWAEEGDIYRQVVAVSVAKLLAANNSTLGDYLKWKEALEHRYRFAASIRSERPTLYAQSISGFAGLARSVGDRRALLRAEQELEDFIVNDGSYNLKRILLACKASSADSMRDWTAMHALNKERLQSVLLSVEEQARASGVPEPQQNVEDVLSFLKERGDRVFTAAIGNSCLGQAMALFRKGDTRTNGDIYAQAMGLLDIAEKAYEGYGSNGFAATRLSRARISHAAPDGRGISDEAAAAEYLTISRTGHTGGIRRNAVLDAAIIAPPGNPSVAERIHELLEDSQSAHPKLRAAEAIWYHKAARADVPGFTWAQVERLALDAANALVVEGRPIDPLLAVDCWLAAVEAHKEMHGSQQLDIRLERQLQAVCLLAMHLVTVTYASERGRVARQYFRVFAVAADMATRLGNAGAAEIIMEAARRDRVGVLLGELSRNPQVHESIRLAAQQIVVANTAAPDVPDNVDTGSSALWTTRSMADIRTSQAMAAADAAKIIGPASTLADFNEFPKIRSGQIAIDTSIKGRPGIVLQLFRPEDGSNQKQELFWVLTSSIDKGQPVSQCGKTILPVNPSTLPPAVDAAFWTELYQLSEYLLPQPLRELLSERAPGSSVSLTIVPTGLLNIPFDSLVVDQDKGLMLIDCATVILTGSLAVTDSIVKPGTNDGAGSWIGVYDTQRLPHAEKERSAMFASHPSATTINTAEELHTVFSIEGQRNVEVLTLAVHGTADSSGWGQSKLMPDGSILRAVDVLRWNAPQYCVLSSCHSSLAANESTELSGFPIALILRGASTVVGSLHEVDDASTAEIMSAYWARAGIGTPAAQALAEAKRDWLGRHPESRHAPWLWAGLISYGRP